MLKLIIFPILLFLKFIYAFVKVLEFTGVLYFSAFIVGYILGKAFSYPLLSLIVMLILVGYLGG